ncbi:MAG: hypothetical protein AAFY38_03955 [Pseudomonadota bacterium]
MRASLIALCLAASPALACTGAPVCQVDPGTLALTRLIDFEGLQAGQGPGYLVDDIMAFDGARIGEGFVGQALVPNGDFDRVAGVPTAPLQLRSDPSGQTKSLVWVAGNTILNGFGPAGFPRRHAQGEGAIAILFENPQPAMEIDIRGGEAGGAMLQFLRADGTEITTLTLRNLGEGPLAFLRADGLSDISGVVLTNEDPQGVAIDNVRFGPPPDLS